MSTNVRVRFADEGETHTLKVVDRNEVNEGSPPISYAGYWYNKNPDVIALSRFWMNQFSQASQNGLVAHEFGHALGLAHNFGDDTQLMDPDPVKNTGDNPRVVRPQSHDRSDYYSRWP